MLHQELLLTLAEISVTIAALSAVAGVVQQQALSSVSSGLLRDVAVIGMMVALFALLPLVFWTNESLIAFRTCAAAAALTWLCGYVIYLRGALKDKTQITTAFWIGMVITLFGICLLVTCMFSEGEAAITTYLLALLTWLAIAGLNFVSSVFSEPGAPEP